MCTVEGVQLWAVENPLTNSIDRLEKKVHPQQIWLSFLCNCSCVQEVLLPFWVCPEVGLYHVFVILGVWNCCWQNCNWKSGCFAWNFGQINVLLLTATSGKWCGECVAMAACLYYSWWRWWSDTLWVMLIMLWLHLLYYVVEISLQFNKYVKLFDCQKSCQSQIEAGAEAVILQPPLLPNRFAEWWSNAQQKGWVLLPFHPVHWGV